MILLNPKGKVNLHTHTSYCDGLNTPEEMVEKAIELGFEAIGFSGHKYTILEKDFCMSLDDTKKYHQDIINLREKYEDKIKIYMGIEKDYYAYLEDADKEDDYQYDYIIGSLHFIEKDGVYMPIDESAEIMEENVAKYFDGNYMEYVKRYYEIINDLPEKTNATIIGHFDLITKFNEGNKYFDENSEEYKEIASYALGKVAKCHPIFEINTGAMAKGYRSRPYPDEFLINEINTLQCPLILSSDCHNKEYLDYGFKNFI